MRAMTFDPEGKIEFFDTLIDHALKGDHPLSGVQWTALRRLRARKPSFASADDWVHILIVLLATLEDLDPDVNLVEVMTEQLICDEALDNLDPPPAPPSEGPSP
jgi:hypothetical protein